MLLYLNLLILFINFFSIKEITHTHTYIVTKIQNMNKQSTQKKNLTIRYPILYKTYHIFLGYASSPIIYYAFSNIFQSYVLLSVVFCILV